MGANLVYLNKPNKEKVTACGTKLGDGNQTGYKWACSSMQGWRINMEDAHISQSNLEDGLGLFAVFDGHGGLEAAKFCE